MGIERFAPSPVITLWTRLLALSAGGEGAVTSAAKRLPAAATASAAATTRRAAATAATTAIARARGGGSRGDGLVEIAAQVIGKPDRIVRPVVAARVPGAGRRGRASRRQHAGEALGPGILDIERNGVGQEALEQLRRLVRRVERVQPVFLGNAEIVAEAFDLIHHLAALDRRRLQPGKCDSRERGRNISRDRGH